MSRDDITQIRVGNSAVGIIGLEAVMEDMAEKYGNRPDEEVRQELLIRLSKRNYRDLSEGRYSKHGLGLNARACWSRTQTIPGMSLDVANG